MLIPIFLPLIVGVIIFLLRKWEYILSLVTTIVLFLTSIQLFYLGEQSYNISWLPFYGLNFVLKTGTFSTFCVMFATLFAMLICLYSINDSKIFKISVKKNVYFSLILINLGIVNGVFLANNFIIFIIFWELAGLILYLLLRFLGEKENYKLATKALYIIGFSDFCLLLGILMLINLTQSTNMGLFNFIIHSSYTKTMFILLIIGALAKAGAVPFHTWIPESSSKVPVTIMTYLVASLDKLLGIYLLSKICSEFFLLKPSNILMIIGGGTIIAAVFMALVQHDLKKLLSYHAVSQVGYMVLGIGSGTAVGLAGGIFHMINNTIYKSCLFLSSGAVESKTNTTDLSKTGSLGKLMPVTFFATTVAALSISGIPPLNGFFSKWMIYQGMIESFVRQRSIITIICLISAMFGSGLTLASFLKVVYSIFLGDNVVKENKEIKEVAISMWLPMIILSVLCIIFGIFAYEIPMKNIVFPIFLQNGISSSNIIQGSWQPYLATILVIMGIFLGIGVYFVLKKSNRRRFVENYLYGEEEKIGETTFPGTDFYLSITNMEPFSTIYFLAKKNFFDFYNWAFGLIKYLSLTLKYLFQREVFDIYFVGKKTILKIARVLSDLHNGNLHRYLSWIMVGFALVLIIFLK
jgi:formate hydrogenlyase subunit 3/multisubunit Na+/H+ antiporter MnhD subunit